MMTNSKEFKLCYIQGNFAYFTNKFDTQWGDDWNDAPYEHNAGEPYCHNGEEIETLAFRTNLSTPSEVGYPNSEYSVEMINNCEIPWLQGRTYEGHFCQIWAGDTIAEFVEKIKKADGEVYKKA